MLYQELIRRKRDGAELSTAEIAALVQGITDGSLGDAQLGAFAMAVVLRGMSLQERVALTDQMRQSGETLTWGATPDAGSAPGPVVDKHSTGGLGDTVSLILAPLLAACGAFVPMIAGRGLGHTGGTIDKLEAIPGYDTAPDLARLRAVVQTVGCAIVGQSAAIAPADRRFYAVRDVTATVESRDLITASILSKKLAAGLEALVLDVKCGNGAFMATPAQAQDLAQALVELGNASGCRTVALLTDMNQPLAPCAGNALETSLAIDVLTGRAHAPRLWQVTRALGAELLVQAGLASDLAAAAAQLQTALQSGAGAERFGRMVQALGGPADLLERPGTYMPAAPVIRDVRAQGSGAIAGIDTRALGMAVIGLGGGRRQAGAGIDPRVGLSDILPIGARVLPGDIIARVHAADDCAARQAIEDLRRAVRLGDHAQSPTLLCGRVAM